MKTQLLSLFVAAAILHAFAAAADETQQFARGCAPQVNGPCRLLEEDLLHLPDVNQIHLLAAGSHSRNCCPAAIS
jgi:hypothetical protein